MMVYSAETDFLRIGYYKLAKNVFPPNIMGGALDLGGHPSGKLQELWPLLDWAYTESYPKFDVQEMSKHYGKNSFDFIFMDQVLEHVRSPIMALSEVRKCLRVRGRVYIATPFLIHVHPDPDDYWRVTRQGLEVWLETAGFKDNIIGSWGNSRAAVLSAKGWPTYGEVVDQYGEKEALDIIDDNDNSRPIVVFGSGMKASD